MMPNRKVEVIGREREIELILTAVLDWGTQKVLFVHGPGGVGKTALLRKVLEQLHNKLTHLPGPEPDKQRYRI